MVAEYMEREAAIDSLTKWAKIWLVTEASDKVLVCYLGSWYEGT